MTSVKSDLPLAALRAVGKVYPGVVACRAVSLEINPGEIHALLGQNGAGKSTLVGMLAGLIRPDTGHLELAGKPVRLSGPGQARKAGIGVIHQAGSLVDSLTVAENLKLRASPYADRRAELPEEFLRNIDDHRMARDLSPRERRLVEIACLLSTGARILVLDEPTAILSPQESERLFADLRRLAQQAIAVVVVSHKLPEVVTHADRLTVLRTGRVVGAFSREEATSERLFQLIQGNGSRLAASVGDVVSANTRPLVRFRALRATVRFSHEAELTALDLEFLRGEVIGLAGRPGSGVATILDILRGKEVKALLGSVEWANGSRDGGHYSRGYVPGGSLAAGGIPSFTVAENLALRHRQFFDWSWRSGGRRRLRTFARALIEQFRITPPDGDVPLRVLSGGNMRKVVLAREIEFAADLLVAVSPSAGLDIAAASFIRQSLRDKARAGTCIVVASDDLDELSEVCDRVYVFSRGRRVAELDGAKMTTEAIGRALSESGSNTMTMQDDRALS